MIRVEIRDSKSHKKVKPRFCDYVKRDDETEVVETKDGDHYKTISVDDLLKQLNTARAIDQG